MAFGLFACSAPIEKGYIVNVEFQGDLAKLKSDTIVLSNFAKKSEDLIEHKAVVVNGKVSFAGDSMPTPQVFYVAANQEGGKPVRYSSAFIEEGKTNIVVTLSDGKPKSEVKGGEYQTVADSFKALQNSLEASVNMDSLITIYTSKESTPEQKAKVAAIHDSISKVVSDAVNQYIEANPTSLYTLQQTLNNVEEIDLATAEARIEAFKGVAAYASNKNLAKLESIVSTLKTLQPGMPAPDFVMNDPKGKPVQFSEFYKKNKVTMIDFWASWCGPCRRFNPTLVSIYKEFKKKGFDIIGVSLDRDQEAWEKAIKSDELKWTHVSDLAYWDNAVAKQYYVRFIPQSVLVDQDGKIIKRQPSEEELVEILKELLD